MDFVRKGFNWSEVHFYRSNFLQNPYFKRTAENNSGMSLLNVPYNLEDYVAENKRTVPIQRFFLIRICDIFQLWT